MWVVGDRRRGEGVPSRFGRGTGMCPLIRLGNCGRKQKHRSMVGGRGQRLYENCFPVRNCSIVTSLVSVFFLFFFFLISVHKLLPSCRYSSITGGRLAIVFPQRLWCSGVCVFSSQTIPLCSNRLPWAQTGSIHRISSPSYMC